MLYYFKKGKNVTEMQKKKIVQCMEKVLWSNMSIVVFKVLCWRFQLDNAPRSGRPVEIDSDQIETLIENSQRYTTQGRANILKISK